MEGQHPSYFSALPHRMINTIIITRHQSRFAFPHWHALDEFSEAGGPFVSSLLVTSYNMDGTYLKTQIQHEISMIIGWKKYIPYDNKKTYI